MSVIVFALTLGIATLWTLYVMNPAISDYDQLHEAVDRIFSR